MCRNILTSGRMWNSFHHIWANEPWIFVVKAFPPAWLFPPTFFEDLFPPPSFDMWYSIGWFFVGSPLCTVPTPFFPWRYYRRHLCSIVWFYFLYDLAFVWIGTFGYHSEVESWPTILSCFSRIPDAPTKKPQIWREVFRGYWNMNFRAIKQWSNLDYGSIMYSISQEVRKITYNMRNLSILEAIYLSLPLLLFQV